MTTSCSDRDRGNVRAGAPFMTCTWAGGPLITSLYSRGGPFTRSSLRVSGETRKLARLYSSSLIPLVVMGVAKPSKLPAGPRIYLLETFAMPARISSIVSLSCH